LPHCYHQRSVNLRPAAFTDARDVANVHVLTWQTAYRDIVPDTYLDTLSAEKRELLWRQAISKGTPELWVAEAEGVITGFVAFGPSRDSDGSADTGEIEAIYVLPAYWGTRTGYGLWCIAQQRFAERGFVSVTLWVLKENLRATRFYESLGFEAESASEKDIRIGGRALKEIRYARNLGR